MRCCSGQRSVATTLKHAIQMKIDVFTPHSFPHLPHPVVKLGSEGFPPDEETTLAQSMEVMSVQSEGIPTTPPSSRCNLTPSLCICCLSLPPFLPSSLPFSLTPTFQPPRQPLPKEQQAQHNPSFHISTQWPAGFKEEPREEILFFFSFLEKKAHFRASCCIGVLAACSFKQFSLLLGTTRAQ